MKTYVLTISETFPSTHSKKGDPTNFRKSIQDKVKIHTIRGNYELWKKRFEKIDKGEAVLSVRVWTGKPYRSKQKEVFCFTAEDRVGVQLFKSNRFPAEWTPGELLTKMSENDGLSFLDFREWFKNYKPGEQMAIIHFTEFRY